MKTYCDYCGDELPSEGKTPIEAGGFMFCGAWCVEGWRETGDRVTGVIVVHNNKTIAEFSND